MQTIAGKYEIVKPIGEGGYGKVYLVRHVDLGVKYALKLLNRSFSSDDRFADRFKREAEILIKFSHPGTVQLRDFGKTEDGQYYMAMDFSEGILLEKIIEQRGRLSPMDALYIMEQVLDVLDAAHRAGIVHRDIKPDNIMVHTEKTGEKGVKLLDFGIAKLREQLTIDQPSVDAASVGTPHYMSPEQAAGDAKLDHRVDIYSAGIVLYEALSGKKPFLGDTVVQTLVMHLSRPAPPFPPEFQIPSYVEQVVRKAMAKNREERYQTAEAFLRALKEAREQYRVDFGQDAHEFLKGIQKAESEARSSGKFQTAAPGPAPKGKTRILCLDDNEMILNILKHILEKDGFEVFTATECQDLHGYLFGHGISLLISDVQMPGLPGTKVCKMLKENMKELKIVLFSNINERDLEKASKESGADDWISKNAKPDDWLNKVKAVLAER